MCCFTVGISTSEEIPLSSKPLKIKMMSSGFHECCLNPMLVIISWTSFNSKVKVAF